MADTTIPTLATMQRLATTDVSSIRSVHDARRVLQTGELLQLRREMHPDRNPKHHELATKATVVLNRIAELIPKKEEEKKKKKESKFKSDETKKKRKFDDDDDEDAAKATNTKRRRMMGLRALSGLIQQMNYKQLHSFLLCLLHHPHSGMIFLKKDMLAMMPKAQDDLSDAREFVADMTHTCMLEEDDMHKIAKSCMTAESDSDDSEADESE